MEQQAESPSLPLPVLLAATAFALAILAVPLARTRQRHAQFLLAAMTLRYLMSVFHDITYAPLAGGLSLNALASAALCMAGAALIVPRRFALRAITPVYLLIGVVLISGALNPNFGLLADTLIKWGYFLVVALCAHEAALKIGLAKLAQTLLWAFLAPFLFQLLSVALHIAKLTDADGSVSYIGGYNHEAAFSILGLTCLVVTGLATNLAAWRRYVLIALSLASLYLANYRTTIIAAAPLLSFIVLEASQAFRREERKTIIVLVGVAGLVCVGVVGWLARERFADFGALLARGGLPTAPIDFTAGERQLFSARLYLWSQYIDAYAHGGVLKLLFGFGPEAWQGQFITYAHNTVVSTLYEYGIVGVAALLNLWWRMFALSLRVGDGTLRWKLAAAHVSFVLLNMSTMGQWLIEGLILYALLCGATILLARQPAPQVAYARTLRQAPIGARSPR